MQYTQAYIYGETSLFVVYYVRTLTHTVHYLEEITKRS